MEKRRPIPAYNCCTVEAVVTVDCHGQIVLPKELRSKAGIRSSDKLAVVSMVSGEKVCCPSLIKDEELACTVGEILDPVARELAGKEVEHGQRREG